MRLWEVHAYSTQDAIDQLRNEGLVVKACVTSQWKKCGSPTDPKEFRRFAYRCLQEYRINNKPKYCLLLVEKPAYVPKCKDKTFVRTYTARIPKNFVMLYEIYNEKTGELIGVSYRKKDALRLAKQLCIKHKTQIVCKKNYSLVNRDVMAFTVELVADRSGRRGIYKAFAIDPQYVDLNEKPSDDIYTTLKQIQQEC